MKRMIALTLLLGLLDAVSLTAAEQPEKPAAGGGKGKQELVRQLAEKTKLTQEQVNTVLAALREVAVAEAKQGLVLPGIGRFEVSERAARKGRNPQTGAEMDIPAKTVVKLDLFDSFEAEATGAR